MQAQTSISKVPLKSADLTDQAVSVANEIRARMDQHLGAEPSLEQQRELVTAVGLVLADYSPTDTDIDDFCDRLNTVAKEYAEARGYSERVEAPARKH